MIFSRIKSIDENEFISIKKKKKISDSDATKVTVLQVRQNRFDLFEPNFLFFYFFDYSNQSNFDGYSENFRILFFFNKKKVFISFFLY